MKQADRLYERFTPAERVSLVVEAMARKDYSEADRLIDTCEIKRYDMVNAEFKESLRMIHTLALHTHIWLLEQQTRAFAALAMIVHYVDGDDEKFERNCTALKDADERILGIWKAWEEFCRTVGVDPEKVMAMDGYDVPACYRRGLANEFLSELDFELEPNQESYRYASGLYETHREKFGQH